MDDFTNNISIPTDDDGFILLQCPKCGECFKLPASYIENNEIVDIHCPLCGLISDNYLTEDVIELAKSKAINMILANFNSDMKKLERESSDSIVRIEVCKPKSEEEIPIKSTIDSMDIVNFDCCNQQGKVRYLLKYCGCYCPYCGGLKYGSN